MKLRLIRHATMILEYGGRRLAVDPILSPAGAMPPIDNSANDRRNPLVDLPINESEILGVDAYLLTHTHRDHFDAAAAERLPKDRPVLCQPADLAKLQGMGFSQAMAVEAEAEWRGLRLTRTGGRHGSGELAVKMGPVSGYVLQAAGEPSLYIAGDTVWCDEVAAALAAHRPQVIVLFAGAAQFLTGGPITMAEGDVLAVLAAAPAAKVVAVHMETFNHCLLTRADLAAALAAAGKADRVVIPADGEMVEL
jgi:L-ascorbate metabolism protein UlaG (beta-lactamase superfamily)